MVYVNCLVVWNIFIHFLFSHILGMSSSQLTNIFQRGSNHQPVSFAWSVLWWFHFELMNSVGGHVFIGKLSPNWSKEATKLETPILNNWEIPHHQSVVWKAIIQRTRLRVMIPLVQCMCSVSLCIAKHNPFQKTSYPRDTCGKSTISRLLSWVHGLSTFFSMFTLVALVGTVNPS